MARFGLVDLEMTDNGEIGEFVDIGDVSVSVDEVATSGNLPDEDASIG